MFRYFTITAVGKFTTSFRRLRRYFTIVERLFFPILLRGNSDSTPERRFLSTSSAVFKTFSTKVVVNLTETKETLNTSSSSKDADFDVLILRSESVDDVLRTMSEKEIPTESLAVVLKRLSELQTKVPFVFETDDRFVKLQRTIEDHASLFDATHVVQSLFYLLKMTRVDVGAVVLLEARLREVCQRLTFSQLLRVAQTHRKFGSTELRRKAFDDTMTSLERRWPEIVDPRDLVSMLYLVSPKNDKFLSNLEDKALDLSEKMNAKDLYRVLYLVATRDRKNLPVVQSLVYRINKLTTLDLNSVQIANLLYAVAKMNVSDYQLMNKIVDHVLVSIETNFVDSIAEVSSVVRSFGTLRWRDERLLDAIFKSFVDNFDVVDDAESWATLIYTAAFVGYLPPSIGNNLPRVVAKLQIVCETKANRRLWLDFVWSLTLLSSATRENIASVLSKDFISSFFDDVDSKSQITTNLKLLNINAVARHDSLDYVGPFIENSFIKDFIKQLPVGQNSPLMDCLVDTLNNIVNLDKYVQLKKKTSFGFIIDATLVLNDSGQPQPLNKKSKDDDVVVDEEVLPKGLHRVAVKLVEYDDMTQGTVAPTGLTALCVRLLSKTGYKVIQIPYNELTSKMTAVQRVRYLDRKMKETVRSAPSDDSRSVSSKVAFKTLMSQLLVDLKTSDERNEHDLLRRRPQIKENVSSSSSPVVSETSVRSKKNNRLRSRLRIKEIFDESS